MTCPVPRMAAQLERDLERLRTGANSHAVNNRLAVVKGIQALCGVACPCGCSAEYLEQLNRVRIWVADRWAERFRPIRRISLAYVRA
jgi:hypothetical protein